MARSLDFQPLENPGKPDEGVKPRARKWSRRDANPTVQMSVRMREDVYERFRDLCVRERRTNGDMLEVMMESYLRNEGKHR